MSLLFWLFTFAVNLWHQKFVTADVTAVFVNNQHGIQQRGQDFYRATACNATHGIAVGILSVCPSDACIVTKLNNALRIL